MKKRIARGFTLIELLVVVAIIAVLSTAVLSSLNAARAKGNDAKRMGDINEIAKAIEYYYSSNGSYPSTGGAWDTQCNLTGLPTNNWIPGLTPNYMATLPSDPNMNPNDSTTDVNGFCCYLYRSDGTNYKLIVGYQCNSYVNYAAHPSLLDPNRDDGSNNAIVDGTANNATHAHAWAIYSPGGATW